MKTAESGSGARGQAVYSGTQLAHFPALNANNKDGVWLSGSQSHCFESRLPPRG